MTATRIAVVFACSCSAVSPAPVTPRTTPEQEQAFLAENEQAMARMMSAMTVKPCGDVDREFVSMMAPHHQGAIDMALSELRYGHNEQLRRLAQEIIITQQEEITAMSLAVAVAPPPSLESSSHHLDPR
jgi:uncharacterized protein (DUF305 family)